VSEPIYTPVEEQGDFDLQQRTAALLQQSLALLDGHGGPLALRARLSDLIDDLDDLWA
jgi:hypothetical protein